ncbi:MAG: SDR family NAD(P)-dependent oxidoreductase [Actinomycetota bacterium]
MRFLITGAASGIGAATTEVLRRLGHRVVGLDLREGPGIIRADVRDQSQVDAAVAEAVEELGGLDVLVNDAGIGEPQDAGAPPDRRVMDILETNYLGAWRVTAAALAPLIESGGRVINVASGLAALTLPLSAGYAASKRALVAYSDVLRIEYGDRITVTTVYPGYIETPIHRRTEEVGIRLREAVPADRMDGAVRAIIMASLGRPRRAIATSARTAAAVWFARHFPRTADAVVRSRVGSLSRRDRYDPSPVARRFDRD